MSKLKIPVPLSELCRSSIYRKDIMKFLLPNSIPDPVSDIINLHDEKPTIVIGPIVEEREDNTPPFYISLNIHNKVLHNCLLDSGASHNLMPKVVMDELGLDITREYHDLFSFDSRKVHCLGVIKDLAVTLQQIPVKSILMDVVVADIPPKFGMLLSRSWAKKLGGSLQMDLSYASVPVFGGEFKRLYRESQLAYTISDSENPANHPIYAEDIDLGSAVLHVSEKYQMLPRVKAITSVPLTCESHDSLWKMYFDGASSKEGAGAGVVLISPLQEVLTFSYKLEFDTTNNIAEYEALLLGLRVAKDMKIQYLTVFGDSELVVQQVRERYQTKNIMMRNYRNEVWDFIENFFTAFNIVFIPRDQNEHADSLAIAASCFKIPTVPKLRYEVEVRYRPSIPDNVRHWKVFEEDSEIQRFLQTVQEFSDLIIDGDNLIAEQEQENLEQKYHNRIAGHEIMQLPTNYIPKELVPLERIFDQNDVPVKPPDKQNSEEVVDCNLGTSENPKFVKISKALSGR